MIKICEICENKFDTRLENKTVYEDILNWINKVI